MLGSPGKKAFDTCPNKTITYPKSFIGREGQTDYYSYGATLACPGAGNGIETNTGFSTAEYARKDLRTTVGKSACATCVFAEMSPLGVQQYKADVANASADAANAEIKALEAKEQHRKLLTEIQKRVEAERAEITSNPAAQVEAAAGEAPGQQPPQHTVAPETPQP